MKFTVIRVIILCGKITQARHNY